MLEKFKFKLGHFLVNSLNWKTSKRIIVFESDDWGGISIPDINTYHTLLKNGIKVDSDPYTKLDNLASEEDLSKLFEVLLKHKDSSGQSSIFTTNTNVSNPDFQKIREHNFQHYFYEPFTRTLERYPHHGNAFQLWQEGISNKIFEPQFHGREHLNTELWLEQLRLGKHKDLMTAFQHDVFIVPKSSYPNEKWILNSAFYPNNLKEDQAMLEAIDSGIDLFTDIFKTSPHSFIATGYFWNKNIEKVLAKKGITSLQGLPIQKQPDYKTQRIKKTLNYTGKRNQHDQIYLVRNAFFEPSLNPGKDVVSDCLNRIELSFKNKKPAIIGTHRLNYIGSLVPENRDKNLILLDKLLKQILIQWPDVQFMSSSQLATMIRNDAKSR